MIPKITLSVFTLGAPETVSIAFNSKELTLSYTPFWYDDIKDLKRHQLHLTNILNTYKDLGGNETEYRLVATVPVDSVKKGLNTVRVLSSQSIVLLDLWLDLDYPNKPVKDSGDAHE